MKRLFRIHSSKTNFTQQAWLNLIFIVNLIVVTSCTVKLHAMSSADTSSVVVDIGSRRELFVDDFLIDRLENARLILNRPQPREVTLTCDAPWEINGPGYTTIFKDGDKYRMYYRADPIVSGEDETNSEVTCYAESKDGINWRKPNLGIYEFNGSKENNIVWRGRISHNITPFRDSNPNCSRDQRYKAIGGVKWTTDGLRAFVSPDAVHWRELYDKPLALTGNFDSQNVVFWDAQKGVYRTYFRDHRLNDPKVPDGRDIRTSTSEDFLTWSEPQWLDYNPNRSGSAELDQTDDPSGDHHQLYTNNVRQYERAPHLMLGFPTRYCDRGWTASSEALPDLEKRRELAAKSVLGGLPTREGTVLWDALFMVSRDRQSFFVWPEAFIRPGIQRPGSWFYGQGSCAYGMVETPSTFVDGPPELSFYVKDNAKAEGPYRLRRYTLRLDGFASVYAPLTGGTVVTKPFNFEGECLEINFSSSAGGRLLVEIQNEAGEAIPGFALEDCNLQYGDQHDRVVSWKSGTDVSSLAGKPVRLLFQLKDADLYSFKFSDQK